MNTLKFDTRVQELKYHVLVEVVKAATNGSLATDLLKIPETICPGPKPTMRCCIYKERAIVNERIKIIMGSDHTNPNVIQVISIACDECPVSGYEVTSSCRGCIAHRCEAACVRKAITFDAQLHAHIDPSKCINCGMCAKACSYSAIRNHVRPCEAACKVKAIAPNPETFEAKIDNSKCTSCGACVYQCPFGAIEDRSYIVDVIDTIKKSENNTLYKTYAIVAPSISSQFSFVPLGKVVSGIKALGFHSVIEVALGADMVAHDEAQELVEKGFLTSSCCPAFVDYIRKFFPMLADKISSNPSPMVALAKYIKRNDPTAKIVFIGPCTAKKMEMKREDVNGIVDDVLTYEELQALFDGLNVDLQSQEETVLDNASYYGRIFARVGGLSDAVAEAVREQGLDKDGFVFNPIAGDGIEACKVLLQKARSGLLPNNFIEGMACLGGCIGGPCALTHGIKDKSQVDKYGLEAKEKTIESALKIIE